jgi:polyphosphate kinase
VYIGSADMMHRNLDRRVEALVRLTKPEHIAETQGLFDLAFDPGTSAWDLDSEGSWNRHHLDERGRPLLDLQDECWRRVSTRRRGIR